MDAQTTAVPARPIELIALQYRSGNATAFDVSGVVRDPSEGRELPELVAVVNLLDADGRVLTSQTTPLERPGLEAGQTSAFSLAFQRVSGTVASYQVGFRLPSGDTIPDVDAAPPHSPRKLHRLEVCHARPLDPRIVRPAAVVALIVSGSSRVRAEAIAGSERLLVPQRADLVTLKATVTDGRDAVTELHDFIVYEDGERQQVSQFEAERVPVSLGLALDTSGSMAGEKMSAAEAAVSRFVVDLLGPRDEVFFYRFDSHPTLVPSWTENRSAVVRSLSSIRPAGGTALYDAVAEAVPLAGTGTRRKKALVVISDGNDTNSEITIGELRQLIRESEGNGVQIGIDGSGGSSSGQTLPFPGGSIQLPWPRRQPAPPSRRAPGHGGQDGVNVEALRIITDDSGGRTEIIYSARDLDPATSGIASELSQQDLCRVRLHSAQRRTMAPESMFASGTGITWSARARGTSRVRAGGRKSA